LNTLEAGHPAMIVFPLIAIALKPPSLVPFSAAVTRGFFNALLTDMYIGDCATIWIEKNILNQVISLTPIYGPTIKCLLDDTGRRPSDVNPDKTKNPDGKKAQPFSRSTMVCRSRTSRKTN
jgi:hypothetical protein